MGLFSNIFRLKSKKAVETQLGTFTLVYSKGKKNIWSNNNSELAMTVLGTEAKPDSGQLKFLENISDEIRKLNEKITERFIYEFNEADRKVDFTDWRDIFKIVGVDVMLIADGEGYWSITFLDLKEPFAQFTLYIEGQKLTDISIDT